MSEPTIPARLCVFALLSEASRKLCFQLPAARLAGRRQAHSGNGPQYSKCWRCADNPHDLRLLLAIGLFCIFWPLTTAVPAYPQPEPPTAPGRRVALIIGNSAYGGRLALSNPARDATAFAEVLGKVSPKFIILRAFDVRSDDFTGVLRQFEKELQGSEAGLFYFAGHSVQVAGENYILPVDMPADPDLINELTEENIAAKLGAVRLNDILQLMERLTRVKLVFLDACRDNPVAPRQAGSASSEPAARSASRAFGASGRASGQGLAPMAATARGSLIAFATSPGMTAADGDGENSPFTLALVHHVAEQGADIQEVMLKVNAEVQENTARMNGQPQIPWVNHSFITKFYLWPWTAGQQMAFLARAEQMELKRLACFPGQPDGAWDARAKRAVTTFNSHSPADVKLDISSPSEADIKRLKALDRLICPDAREDRRAKVVYGGDDKSASQMRLASPPAGDRSPVPSLGGGMGIGGF